MRALARQAINASWFGAAADDTASFAVHIPRTLLADTIGVLIVAWEAWTQRVWVLYSVQVRCTGSANLRTCASKTTERTSWISEGYEVVGHLSLIVPSFRGPTVSVLIEKIRSDLYPIVTIHKVVDVVFRKANNLYQLAYFLINWRCGYLH
jgi:hypothetical protein